MQRFSLKTMMISALLVAILLGCFRSQIAELLGIRTSSPVLTPITSAKLMERALSDPNAIVFANADWSIDSSVARIVVSQFAEEWPSMGDRQVTFYLLDVSNQNFPHYVKSWVSSDPTLTLRRFVLTGYGNVVWLSGGRLMGMMSACGATTDVLQDKTEKAFGN